MQPTIDFADLFTQRARQVLPLVHDKGLAFLFDYHGAQPQVRADPSALGDSLQRLFSAAVDILEEGFVFLTAHAFALPGQRWRLEVAAAASGRHAAAAARQKVLERLQLVQPGGPDQPAEGRCALTGGITRFTLDPKEGSLFSLELELPGSAAAAPEEGAVAAQGARAWIIGSGDFASSLDRRLQRMGWATRTLPDVETAARELERMPGEHSRPALLLAQESGTLTLARLRWLWALLPSSTQVVLGVRPDSPLLARAGADANIQVRACPFGPAELDCFARRATHVPAPSGLTEPAPLSFEHRRRALVVDDNAVNLMVASGMLQVLGFEVDTASDGVEAIDRCMAMAPDLVLMDLHMPGMDGLEATRRLRLLQREGAMPSFPILAATADTTAEDACEAAGMDAHLPKPLNLAGLESQVKRLLRAP